MKKNLVKLAMIGLAAGLCVSAKAAPAKKTQEVAMAKCSKDKNGKRKCDTSCNNRERDCGCSNTTSAGRNGYTLDSFEPENTDIAARRKSAAQKVLEGY
jgi:hypothetical protein